VKNRGKSALIKKPGHEVSILEDNEKIHQNPETRKENRRLTKFPGNVKIKNKIINKRKSVDASQNQTERMKLDNHLIKDTHNLNLIDWKEGRSKSFFKSKKPIEKKLDYIDHIKEQLLEAEIEKKNLNIQTILVDKRINDLKTLIYQSNSKKEYKNEFNIEQIEVIKKINEEKFKREDRILSMRKKIMEHKLEIKKKYEEKENELISKLAADKKDTIIENLGKIKKRAEARKLKESLANKVINSLILRSHAQTENI